MSLKFSPRFQIFSKEEEFFRSHQIGSCNRAKMGLGGSGAVEDSWETEDGLKL